MVIFSPLKSAGLDPAHLLKLTDGLQTLLRTHFWAKILAALFAGVGAGILIGPELGLVSPAISEVAGDWLALPGQLFLALVQMVVIPLIFASVVRGIAASESVEQLKSLGLRVAVYYVFTTTVAISIGLAVAFLLRPGDKLDKASITALTQAAAPIETSAGSELGSSTLSVKNVPKLIPSIIPDNPFSTLVAGDMLQIVLIAMFLGIALMALSQEAARPLLDLLNSVQQVSMVVIKWAMYLAPVAVFGLMAKLTSSVGWDALFGLSAYVLTVLLGLGLVLVFYALLVAVIGKRNPLTFFKNIRDVQLLAFSTSSSAAVMPLTIKTAQEKLNIKKSVAEFIVPLGTTINMDGTALYQGVATVFLAQVYDVNLSLSQLILVVVTATAASIGAPGTPGVGIVILSMILSSVGIPASGIVIIMAVDRVLDMARTVINVTGDFTAAAIMDRVQIEATSPTGGDQSQITQ